MKRIGFIGLGIMGLPMASNLVSKTEVEVLGFDIQKTQLDKFKAIGGIVEEDVINIFKNCDVVFICLPTNDLLKETVQIAIEKDYKDVIIVDLGSTSPNIIRELHKKAAVNNIKLVDAPVSGGEIGAINGSLAIMCGGEKEIFDKISSLLYLMGSTVTYMGETGCGSVSKLANNMIVGCNLAAVAEAFTYAKKAGIDPSKLYSAIKDGFAGSEVLTVKVPKIISRDFNPSARLAVHQKDLVNAIKLAEEMDVDIPMTRMVLQFMNEMETDGKINEDQCALVKIYEKQMNVEVK